MLHAQRQPNPVFSDEYGCIVAELKAARARAGLSQRELAARLGRSASHVARIEAGQRRVDVLELLRMSELFGLSPDALVGDIVARLHAAGLQPTSGSAAWPGPMATHSQRK